MDERAGLVEVAAKGAVFEGDGVEALGRGGVVEEGGAEDDDGALGRGGVVYFGNAAGVAGWGAADRVAVDGYASGVASWVPGHLLIRRPFFRVGRSCFDCTGEAYQFVMLS